MADLSRILKSGEYSDVTIKCLVDGSEFEVHRTLLSQSPVLKAMCDSGMKETHTGVIEDQETRGKVMACLLDFIYTGHFNIASPMLPYEGAPVTLSCFTRPPVEVTGSPQTIATDSDHELSDAQQAITIDLAIYRDLQIAAGFYLLPSIHPLIASGLSEIISQSLPVAFPPTTCEGYWKVLAEISKFEAYPIFTDSIADALNKYFVQMNVRPFSSYFIAILGQHAGAIAHRLCKWRVSVMEGMVKRLGSDKYCHYCHRP